MTLQQLRYLIAIAEHSSMNSAAQALYVSQSNLSTAIRDLENELGVTIFVRSNRGVSLTNDGTELLGYARQVVEQADMLESRYAKGSAGETRLAVSAQHYSFCLQAFINVVEACEEDSYDFVLRESATHDIIEDVRTFRSEVGILYLDAFNGRVLARALEDAGLVFTPLFAAQAHVFVNENHPLAGKDIVSPDDLEPYARYSFEQGTTNSFYYSEEPLSYLPHSKSIRFTDRGTLSNLLANHDGYTISTGVLSPEMLHGVVAIPLDVDEIMEVGYVTHQRMRPSRLLTRYIHELHRVISANPTVNASYEETYQQAAELAEQREERGRRDAR